MNLVSWTPSRADTLFWEDFNGFSYSTDNPGLPLQSKGADEFWYGGRFETPDGGTIDSDLAVQAFGGTGDPTPVGRFEDDAGLLFQVSTQNFSSVTLSFDWRTFQAETNDRIKVGFYIGDLGADFGASRYHDWFADFGQVAPRIGGPRTGRSWSTLQQATVFITRSSPCRRTSPTSGSHSGSTTAKVITARSTTSTSRHRRTFPSRPA